MEKKFNTQAIDKFYFDFVKKVLEQAKLLNGDESDQAYIANMAEELQNRVGIMILDELSENDIDEYTKLISEGNPTPEEIYQFLKEKIADFDAKRDKVLEDFAAGILQRTADLQDVL